MTGRTIKQLVVCLDGPKGGQWFFATDWDEQVAAAQRMLAAGQRRAPCLDYQPAGGEPIANPAGPGAPLRYRPAGWRTRRPARTAVIR